MATQSAARPTLAALCRRLSAGDTTSLELVDECLERIEARESLGAVLALNPAARFQATQADRHPREPRGPLHGIPILVKDVFETAGIATTFGCGAFEGNVPQRDAAAVRRLREAGAIVLGKTSTPDLAMSWLSDSSTGVIAVNSRSRWHEAGGSSSGSAVAVAAGLAPAALGSDTGGSVRVPASFNGLVGMRPTTGLVPAQGMSALVSAQDTAGPLTCCVEDAGLLLGVLARRRWELDRHRPLADFRLGVLAIADRSTGWEGADEVSRVLEMAVSLLAAETVVVPELDALLRDSALYLVSARADIDAFLSSRPGLRTRSFLELYDDDVFPEGLDLARLLATRSHDDPHDRARRVANRGRLRAAIVRSMSGFDALVYPTVQVPAPRRDRQHPPSRLLPVNTLIASQADLPAVTIPAGTTREGLPIGLELLGRPGTDGALLRLAGLVERVLKG